MNNELQQATSSAGGDADIAAVATLVGEPSRARVLMALMDGRALSASVLAVEAGLSRPAVSAHLGKLVAGGLIAAEKVGRHRYYRLTGSDIADLVESLARLAPAQPIRSLRQGTRAQALRSGRTCYDHLAGALGVAITGALLECGALVAEDQHLGIERRSSDPLAGSVSHSSFQLGTEAPQILARLGVDLTEAQNTKSRRPLLRACVDWSEQRHHLAGQLGALLATALMGNDWITQRRTHRAVALTDRGADGLKSALGCVL